MTKLQEQLFALKDDKYAEFQAKLTPTISKEKFIGVRLPALRTFAKDFSKTPECREFLKEFPHEYYDETLLHSIILEKWKNYDECMTMVEEFLPYVDNWAACDSLRPKVFAKHKEELMEKILVWVKSPETYTVRFALDMLMTHFLDDDFEPSQLEIAASPKSDEYYVKMMVAWYFATALAKQWDATIPYIEEHRLSDWTHRKTIQKAIESYRITDEQKTYLKTFR